MSLTLGCRLQFPLREDVSTFRAPIEMRWAEVHVLDEAGRVQGNPLRLGLAIHSKTMQLLLKTEILAWQD